MELFTRSKDPGWDRVVHVQVTQEKDLSKLVWDDQVHKLLIVDEGSMNIHFGDSKKVVIAPAVILLGDERVTFSDVTDVSMTTVYFRSTEVRDEFTGERIKSGEFDREMGKTIYQDYLLVKGFTDPGSNKVIAVSPSSYGKISKLAHCIKNELTEQADGYWPCRSRSFLMELLYSINYLHVENKVLDVREMSDGDLVDEIKQYLNEHISEKVALEDILKEYSMNRNTLNKIFIKETSMTCLNYLEKMRINLAQLMLADTELQIAEIADRVGYPDPNYFIKVFKKHTGATPSNYRESCK